MIQSWQNDSFENCAIYLKKKVSTIGGRVRALGSHSGRNSGQIIIKMLKVYLKIHAYLTNYIAIKQIKM